MLRLFIFLCLVLSISVSSHGSFLSSSKSNFIELGVGVTRFGFSKEYLQDYNVDPSLNLKLVFAGRMGRKPHAWFELGYQYNGAFITLDESTYDNGNTQVTQTDEDLYLSQSLSLGFRFTTNPYRSVASYIRLGGGRVFTTLENETTEAFANGNNSQKTTEKTENKTDFIYGALGMSFKIDRYQRLSIDAQQNQYSIDGTDLSDQLISVNWTKFL
jgi:hypothetical protein